MTSSGGGGMLLAGAVSGLVEGLSIQPLEMLKTRLQINTGAHMPLLPTVRDIISEGGARQLYRGGLAEVTGLLPRASAALTTLEGTKRFLQGSSEQLAVSHAYIAGAASGVSEAVVFSPFQVIKVRLMAKEHLGVYCNTLDCLHKIVKTEGLRSLTIGIGPTLMRNCVWNSLFYGGMHQVETHHLPPLDNVLLSTVRSFGVGFSIGVLATCFNAPFDVVKSRMQSQLPGNKVYTSTFQALSKIYREEGSHALYRGFVPKALRLGVGQTVGLLCFQNILAVVEGQQKENTHAHGIQLSSSRAEAMS